MKLRAFLRSTHTIGTEPAGNYGGYRSRPSVRFSVSSAQLAERILCLGRYDGPINATLVESRDFWRGVVDGDGSLGILATGYAYFGLVGSRRLLEAFLLFLRSNDLDAKMTIRPDKTIFQIATAGYTAERIVCFLYDNTDVALDRKAAAATEILAARDAQLCAERSRLAQIADWYQSGETLKQIGSRLEVSNVTILRWMAKEVFLVESDTADDGLISQRTDSPYSYCPFPGAAGLLHRPDHLQVIDDLDRALSGELGG